MLALASAAAAQGSQSSGLVLVLIAAVGVAIFWRGLIKVGLALIVVLFAVLLVGGAEALIHGIQLLIP
jgi:hypothetical protein